MSPNASRDRLIKGIYKPTDQQQTLGQLDYAFRLCVLVDPLEKKIAKSDYNSAELALVNKLITNEEYQLVLSARAARRQVIEVDHFTAQLEEDAS